jgi:hypothetical protein
VLQIMKKILIFLLIILLQLSFIPPAFAFDSVDTFLAKHPAQAAQFAKQLGINHTSRGTLANTASTARNIAVRSYSKSGQLISSSPQSFSLKGVLGGFIGRTVEGFFTRLGGVAAEKLLGLEETAADRYIAQHPEAATVGIIRGTAYGGGCVNVGVVTHYIPAADVPYLYPVSDRFCGSDGHVIYKQNSGRYSTSIGATLYKGIPEITYGSDYNSLTDAQKQAAFDLLTDAEKLQAFDPQSPISIPSDAARVEIVPDGDLTLVGPDGNLINIPGGSPYSLNLPSSPEDSDGDGIPNSEEVSGDIPSLEDEECFECEKQFQNVENFVSYAIKKSKDKFPFDILGDWEVLKENASNECPKYTFWGKQQEVCFVRDLFVGLKFSIWVSFIVRMILSI